MTSASEHTKAVYTQPFNFPHVLETQHPPLVAQTTMSHAAKEDTTDIARQNIVASDVGKQDVFQSIDMQSSIGVNAELEEDKGVVDSDPLRNPQRTHFSTCAKEAQDVTVLEDEVDVVDSNRHVLYPDIDTKPPPAASRRASYLRLDLKPPSPRPWELIGPPEESRNDGRNYRAGPQKSHAIRSAGCVVPSDFIHILTLHDRHRPSIPKSSYYFGPPPSDSAFGTAPAGQIGVHHPREIIRIERDYTGGELIQFAAIYPLELEGRVRVMLLPVILRY